MSELIEKTNHLMSLTQRIRKYANDADSLAKIPLKHVHFIGTEDEGAVPTELRDTSLYHYDSSVHVVGDDDNDDECNCYEECNCSECLMCSHCDEHIDDCECESCILCYNCDSPFSRCSCYLNDEYVDTDCSSCKENTPCHFHELEGFNNNCRIDCESSHGTYYSCNQNCGCECNCCDRKDGVDGEIVSRPLLYSEVLDFMDKHHVIESNNSCGGHRHFSFISNVRAQSILLNRKFNDRWLPHFLTMWGKEANVNAGSAFWKRLDGDVHWCKQPWNGIRQIMAGSTKDDCRYNRVNYCFGLHGTMEIRVLPEFQKFDLMRSSTIALAHIVDEFVEHHKNDIGLYKVSL